MVRRGRVTTLFLIILISNLIPLTSGADDVSNRVDADLKIIFLDGVNLSISMELKAYELRIFGKSYGAEEIRETYTQNGAAFEQVLFEGMESILGTTFHDCIIHIGRPHVRRDSLADIPTKPVEFDAVSNLTLTSAFFNADLPKIGDFINGILDMGGEVLYEFNFYADPGWNVSFDFMLNDKMKIVEAVNGIVSSSGMEAIWKVNNWNGESETEEGSLKISYKEPTTKVEDEKVKLEVYLDLSNINKVFLNCSMNILSCKIEDLAPLPPFVTNLKFVPADGIRLLIEEGLVSWDKVEETLFTSKKSYLENRFRECINTSVAFGFRINYNTSIGCAEPYNLTHMDSFPPVSGTFFDSIDFRICNLTPRAFFGFIYAGGEGKLTGNDIPFRNLGYPFSLYLILPEELGGKIKCNATSNFNLTLKYKDGSKYDKELVEDTIEMFLDGIDLDVLAFLSGGKSLVETFGIRYDENIHRIVPQPEFDIPPCISIDYMNSDLLKLCIEEGIITKESLNSFIVRKEGEAKSLLLNVLGIPVEKYITLDKERLEKGERWDGNIKKMDDREPFTIPFYVRIPLKANFTFSILPPSLETKSQTFVLKGVPGRNVTYRIFIPKDMEINFKDTLGRVRMYKMSDGKTLLEAKFYATEGDIETTLYYSIKLHTLSIILIFLPLIIILAVIVILIAIIIFLRKKRRGAPPAPTLEREEKSEEQS